MSALAIPEPAALDLAQVADLAQAITAWADTIDDVAAIRDTAARWAAITEYVRRKSTQGLAVAEAALRRLEVRVGVLLGPAVNGGDRRSDQFDRDRTDLTPDARREFRTLAEHADVVEQVIAESTDQRPPSRRRCLLAIQQAEWAAEDAEVAEHMPRIAAALAALDEEQVGTFIITARLTGVHRDDISLLLRGAEVLNVEEEQPCLAP